MCLICMLEFMRDAKIKEEEKKPEIKEKEAQKEKVEFAIWDEKQSSDKTRKVFFKLKKDGVGDINLIAVNEDGSKLPDGNILYISREGKLELYESINKTIGLELNEHGSIITETE